MADYPTLIDVSKTLDPDGKTAVIAEILNETNELLDDVPWTEGNLPTGHRMTVRTGLPEATWRQFNQGVQPTKSTTAQVTEACGMLEDYAEIDKDLAELNGNTTAYRLQENRPHLEGMSQAMANAFIYGDGQHVMGLAPRFNTGDAASAQSAENVIDGGGTGSDNTSIWLVGWSVEKGAFGFFPKGSKAGLSMEDKGRVTIENAGGVNGARMEAYRTHYQWKAGLGVLDWRYVVRIANVDVTALTKNAASGADLIDLLVQALERIQGLTGVRPVFYCSRTIRSFLRRQMLNKSNVLLSLDEVAGKKVLSFDGVPLKRVDAILDTEAAVTGF